MSDHLAGPKAGVIDWKGFRILGIPVNMQALAEWGLPILKSAAASIVTVIIIVGAVVWGVRYWDLQDDLAHALGAITSKEVKTLVNAAADGRITPQQLDDRLKQLPAAVTPQQLDDRLSKLPAAVTSQQLEERVNKLPAAVTPQQLDDRLKQLPAAVTSQQLEERISKLDIEIVPTNQIYATQHTSPDDHNWEASTPNACPSGARLVSVFCQLQGGTGGYLQNAGVDGDGAFHCVWNPSDQKAKMVAWGKALCVRPKLK